MEPVKDDLATMLDYGDNAMVTLLAGETQLVAHRAVLAARSPVFEAMLQHKKLKASSGRVTITDVEGPVLRQLLVCVYTLEAPQLPNLSAQVRAAANRYCLSGLKAVCNQKGHKTEVVDLATLLASLSDASDGAKGHKTEAVDLATLLDATDGATVTLSTGDTQLVAHRAVLSARSPVFAAMFGQDTLEASSGHVDVADVEGAVLRQLLAYCYTLRAPQLPALAPQLLAAAVKYGLSDLTAACEQQVAALLTVENAAAAAVLAVRHCCPELRRAAVSFIKAHTHQVMMTQGLAEAVLGHPHAAVELTRLITEPDMRSLSQQEKNRQLLRAAEEGAVEEVRTLLKTGADESAEDGQERTALHLAAGKGHVAVVWQLLLLYLPAVNARDAWQRTPLHCAAEGGHTAVVRLLVDAGANVDARTESGRSPLHCAAAHCHTEVVDALLRAGANKYDTDFLGRTPHDDAKLWGNHQLIGRLNTNVYLKYQ